jgi:hypothetical protein
MMHDPNLNSKFEFEIEIELQFFVTDREPTCQSSNN